MPLLLRQATTADLELLLPFARQTFHEAYAHLNDPVDFGAYMQRAFVHGKWQAEIADPKCQFWLAEQAAALVGYIKVNFGEAQSDLKTTDGLELERIYVLNKLQGQNIGSILMEKAVEIARSTGMKYIWLGVWDQNPKAIKFYEREGFRQFGTHVFQLGADAQTDVLMRLDL